MCWRRASCLIGLLLIACQQPEDTVDSHRPTVVPIASPLPTGIPGPRPVPTVNIKCRKNGLLPDPVCTPGAVNPQVTQNTIKSTICVRGWTATVRPPQSYTDQLKREQLIAYGLNLTTVQVKEDHFIPLDAGGAPWDPKNLWPQPNAEASQKDAKEYAVVADICNGRITLHDAQVQFVTDWTKYSAKGNNLNEVGVPYPTPDEEP